MANRISKTQARTGPRRAGLYVRISHDRMGDEAGVTRQLEDCQAKAKALDWEVVAVYTDNDVSATRSRVRPEYSRMMVDLESGRIDAIICATQSRLTRRPAELAVIMDLVAKGRLDLALVTGNIDFLSATGRMAAGMVALTNQHEAEQISERVMRKQQQLREQGLPFGGGKRPYGYDASRRVVIKSEAKVIKRIARDILAGVPTGTIAQRLNDAGVPTVEGRPWNRTTVRAVVTKPRLWGDLTFKGEVLGKGQWPTILEPSVGERLLAVLGDEKRKTVEQDGKRRHLLSGVAKCAVCDTRMYVALASHQPNMAPRYKCRKACTAINRDNLDRYVMERVLRRVPVGTSVDPAQEKALRLEIEQLKQAREKVLRAWEVGELSDHEWQSSRARTGERMAKVQADLDALLAGAHDLAPDMLIENAGELTLLDKRRLVERYVTELKISRSQRRGRGFDEDRVHLELSGQEVDYKIVDDNPADPWTTVRAVPKRRKKPAA